MKKIFKVLAALLIVAGLSSCNAEIKNIKINNLIGTWDLVSETIVSYSGTETTTTASAGHYIVITESTFTEYSGSTKTEYPMQFSDPHLILSGAIYYDIVSLTYKEMVLSSDPLLPLYKEKKYTYKRR
jgi:hypothetical protein